MFIGHFAAGFGAKKIDTRPSLGTLFIAAQLIDLLWPVFLLLGLEKVKVDPGNTAFTPLDFIYYPFTHSLLGVLIWALLLSVVYFALRRNRKGAVVLGGLVVSHWLLDLLTHRPDLALVPWVDIKVGLGLWNSVPLALIVESALFFGGVYIYSRATTAKTKKGAVTLWSFVAFLFLVYVLNAFGSPPPSEKPVAYMALSMWLLVAWGYWIDRNRKPAE
jgi:membrane-bound metal-dependent hydrolase YbcI (DUF457 family)